MNSNTFNRIKDKLYEAEGLLELLTLRREKQNELLPMIIKRIEEAAEIAKEVKSASESFPAEESESVSVTEIPDRIVIDENYDEGDEDEDLSDLPDESVEDPVTEESEPVEKSEEYFGDVDESEDESVDEPEDETEDILYEVGNDLDADDELKEDLQNDEPLYVEMSDEPEVNSVGGRVADVAQKKNPAFCLNDRFRFTRSLFGGSSKDFNAAMDYLATLATLEEAEDYFYGERGLEPEDEDVMDFMEIIKDYYGR